MAGLEGHLAEIVGSGSSGRGSGLVVQQRDEVYASLISALHLGVQITLDSLAGLELGQQFSQEGLVLAEWECHVLIFYSRSWRATEVVGVLPSGSSTRALETNRTST